MDLGFLSLTMILLLTLLQCLDHVTGDEYRCYAEEHNPYVFFASRTAYQFVREKSNIKPVPECAPVQLWLFSRHGTRYPKKKRILKMRNLLQTRDFILQNHENKSGILCEKDIDALRRWQYNLRPEQNYQLTTQGHEDLAVLGLKLKMSFPELFNNDFSVNKFQFATTFEPRTVDSARSFVESLFPGKEIYIPHPPHPDKFLNVHHNCPVWEEKVLNNPESERETELFRASALYKKMIHDVSQRLGFNHDLTSDTVSLMYDMCSYEKAWYVSSISPWCAVFTRQDLEIFEYAEDLTYWYQQGYGNEDMNAKLGCIVVRDLVTNFDNVVRNGMAGAPIGLFRFSHSTLLLMTLVKLGLAKDSTRLTWQNYESMSKREWRSTFQDCFASNIMAVLYKCKSSKEYNVVFYQNERVVNYPGCNAGLCSWSYLSHRLKSAFNCTADFCNRSSIPPLSVIPVLCLLFSVIYLK